VQVGTRLYTIIWSAVTGVLEQTLAGPTGIVTSASFSPDGEKVVSCCVDDEDKNVWVWRIGTAPLDVTIVSRLFRWPDGDDAVTRCKLRVMGQHYERVMIVVGVCVCIKWVTR
jgi:WD40 repeat protein